MINPESRIVVFRGHVFNVHKLNMYLHSLCVKILLSLYRMEQQDDVIDAYTTPTSKVRYVLSGVSVTRD